MLTLSLSLLKTYPPEHKQAPHLHTGLWAEKLLWHTLCEIESDILWETSPPVPSQAGCTTEYATTKSYKKGDLAHLHLQPRSK